MRNLARLLNEMRASGIILDYALFGAVAQMRYTEPVATLDADVLVAVPAPDRVDVLAPIYEYCASRGFGPEGEAIRVGRPKDFTRVLALLDSGSVERREVGRLAERHGLARAWDRFEKRFLSE